MGGAKLDGALRDMVRIVELIDSRPYICQPVVYGRLIYTVIIYFSHRLLTQEKTNPILPPLENCAVRTVSAEEKVNSISAYLPFASASPTPSLKGSIENLVPTSESHDFATPSLQRRTLNLKAKFESGSS